MEFIFYINVPSVLLSLAKHLYHDLGAVVR
jgi:hypothetical protein